MFGSGSGSVSGSSGLLPPMVVNGGARNDRTITGALAGASNINVDMARVRDQDTPYTAQTANRDLVNKACHEMLGDNAKVVLEDTSNHGKSLGKHAVNIFVLSQEPGAKETPEFEKAHKALNKAVTAFAISGEDGYSSTCNVKKKSAYNVNKKLGCAITALIKGAPGVYDTAAGMMYTEYLRDGLPKAAEARLQIRNFTQETINRISLFGNATTIANFHVQQQLNRARSELNESSLTNFIGEMLNQLDLGMDPVRPRSPEREVRPHTADSVSGSTRGVESGAGGSASIGNIVIKPNINIDMKDFEPLKNLLAEKLQQATNLGVPPPVADAVAAADKIPAQENVPAGSDLPVPQAGIMVESEAIPGIGFIEGSGNLEQVDAASPASARLKGQYLFGEIQLSDVSGDDRLASFDEYKGAPSTELDNNGSSTTSQISDQDLFENLQLNELPVYNGDSWHSSAFSGGTDRPDGDGPEISHFSTEFAARAQTKPTFNGQRVKATGLQDRRSVTPKLMLGTPSIARAPGVLPKLTSPVIEVEERLLFAPSKPDLSFGIFQPHKVIFEFNLNNMPGRAPNFVGLVLNKADTGASEGGRDYFRAIGSGIQSTHSAAQKLKNYIRAGKDPSQINTTTLNKEDMEIGQLFDMAEKQNPNFGIKLRKAFQEFRKNTQHTGPVREPSKYPSRAPVVVLSPGSSSAMSGFILAKGL